MKNFLNYQTSEYDCGPVTLLNGIRYLFDREEISPEIIKFITLYCMDSYNEDGEIFKDGTSPDAVFYMTGWFNHFAKTKNFPLHCEFSAGESVIIHPGHPVYEALINGGVVALRLFLEIPHYVLLTGIVNDRVLLFDPYYEEDSSIIEDEYASDEIEFLHDTPKEANRSVSIARLNRTSEDFYEMGNRNNRVAMIMYRTDAD